MKNVPAEVAEVPLTRVQIIDGVEWGVILTTVPTVVLKSGKAELPAAILDYDAKKIWLNDGPGQIQSLAGAIVAIGAGGGAGKANGEPKPKAGAKSTKKPKPKRKG